MTGTNSNAITTMLSSQRSAIAEQWVKDLLSLWQHAYPGLINQAELQQLCHKFLQELESVFGECQSAENPGAMLSPVLVSQVQEFSKARAKEGFKPVDTAQFALVLKQVLCKALIRAHADKPEVLVESLQCINDVLDRLSLLTFEVFVEAREHVIVQQGLSLRELSTPVIQLWDGILLLPLVGLIDTVRARQFTERLLEAISRYESTVTIIDVTGVPIFDTGVAKHIMKTVDAAQLLGAKIVMTGLSPEGAQTLTKLGVSFSGVLSRATLRAGVAEAFRMVNRSVVSAR